MPVPFLNPATGQLEMYAEQDLTPDNLQALAGRGLRQATPEDVANRERTLKYSTVAQQSLAQAERAVRGATLGQIDGIGSDEEIRARADVSQEVSPVLSTMADFAPDVALGVLTGGVSALATSGGRIAAKSALKAGLRGALGAAAKEAPLAALAGETIAGGLVTASQQAFQEGRQFFREDPVTDATNTLLWTGIGGVLGGAPMAFKAARSGLGKVGKEAAELADEADLEAAFKAGEDSAPVGVAEPATAAAPQHPVPVGWQRGWVPPPDTGSAVKTRKDFASINDYLEYKANLRQQQITPVPETAGASTPGVPLTSDEGTLAAARAKLSPSAQAAFDRSQERVAAAGSVSLGDGWRTGKASVDAGLEKRLRSVLDAAQASDQPLTAAHLSERAGLRHKAGWEVDELEKQGLIRRVTGDERPKGGSVEIHYEPVTKAPDEPVTEQAVRPGFEGFTGKPRMAKGSKKFADEARNIADTAIVGKSLTDLHSAGPLDEDALAKYRNDEGFLANGTSRNKASSGPDGLPKFIIDPLPEGDVVKQVNGAHRLTVARERGLDAIEGIIQKYGPDGDVLWEYRGPIKVGSGKPAPRPRGGERGMAAIGGEGPNFSLGDVATSPLGNVAAAGAGAAIGGQAGGQEGALAGGALGFLGSALLGGRAGRRVAREAAAGVVSKEAAQVARQVDRGVAKAERNAVRSQAEDIVNRVAKGESPLKEGGGFMRDSRLAQYQPEIIETATKEMRNDLNELNKLSQGIRERAVKQSDVAKNIADNLPAQKAKAREIALAGQRLAGEIRADAHALAAQMGKKVPQYFSGTARDIVTSLRERTIAISKMTDGAEIFNALDDLKRVVDNSKVALEQGSRRSAKDPLAYQNLIPRVEEFANQVRASLEDVPTFGRAGEMQKAYNATYHQKWFPAKRVFEESVFKVTGRDYRAFDTLDAWEGKITSLLKDAGTGERRHVGDMLSALKEMAEQRAKYGTASKAETGRITELVDKITRTFELADETTAAARRMQNLTNAAGVAAGAAGAVFGGLPGAVISGGIARGAAELATGKYRRAFMSMRGATDDAVNKSVDDWIGISKVRSAANDTGKSARKRLLPTMSDEDKALLKSAKRLGSTFGVAAFLGDNDDAQSAFAQKKSALMDDVGFMNRFSEEFGDLAQEEPSVYMVAAGKAAEVRKFLVDRLPANIAVSMARPNGYPPTNEAVEDWSVYWNAATNPRTVIASLSRGDIRPQEVETLRTLYRPLYESLQASLIDRISRAQELGDDLDDQFVLRMSMLFDLDGAGTPAFSNRAAAVARSVQPQQPAQPKKPFAPKAGTRVSPSNVAITGPTYGSLG